LNDDDDDDDNSHRSLTAAGVIKNFPFTSQRNNQAKVLNEICNAFNSGYKYLVWERQGIESETTYPESGRKVVKTFD
jgi:hypothetical protein